ncbi:MAG: hypothetical protein EAX96_20925 [Candidatus Lokiarchaeota archaeon]|nr:hypothetical protein [Candidatus Lokiarchaeota archaeon]
MNKKYNIFSVIIITSSIIAISIGIILFVQFQQGSNVEGYLFIDSKNRQVIVPYHPNRIISLAPSITEILYALEVDDRLVGVTSYCNYPEDVVNKTIIGGFHSINLEIIISLNPDLIIAANWNAETVMQIEQLGFPIVIILADTLNKTIDNIGLIGNLTNSETKASEIMETMYTDMETIMNKTNKINQTNKFKCYFEVWETPKVAGGSSFLNDMINKAGAINIFGTIALEWPIVSHEWIIASNPEAIFITEHASPHYSQDVSSRTGYDTVNACIENRVFQCYDDIYLRQGPRIILALENMTNYLYPSLFL